MVAYLNKGIKQSRTSGRSSVPPPPEIQLPKNPHYLMVTGNVDIRRSMGLREKASMAAVYVAETTTGIIMAYTLPWDSSKHVANVFEQGQLIPLTGYQFSAPVIAAGGE
jgi:hypothetical protein